MAIKPIVGEIKAQPLNDNFSYLESKLSEESDLEQRFDAHLADKSPHDEIPYVRMYLSANQSIPNSERTKVAIDGVNEDNDNIADPTNNRLVIKTAGIYMIWGIGAFATNATGFRHLELFKNNTNITPTTLSWQNAVTGGQTTLQFVWSIKLNIGDYIDLRAYQNSGGALLLSGGSNGDRTHISMLRIGG